MGNEAKIVDFCREPIPMGQALLKAGFRIISPDEMGELLEFKKLRRQKEKEICEELREKHPRKKLRRDTWGESTIHYSVRGGWGIFSYEIDYKFVPRPSLSFTKLKSYARKEIPDRCLEKVRKAKELGASKFYVVEPTFKSPDPIIVAKLGDDYLYITHWGPENT
jgi:hypothetical protein